MKHRRFIPDLLNRLLVLWVALAFAVTFGAALRAETPMINATHGAAIGGYDPVAYFEHGAPRKGDPDHNVMWKGAVWFFVTAQNRETFESNPHAYAPRYGGYCAYSVAHGATSPTDPTAWLIHDGRLYLTHNDTVRQMWQKDVDTYVARADQNWPAVLAD